MRSFALLNLKFLKLKKLLRRTFISILLTTLKQVLVLVVVVVVVVFVFYHTVGANETTSTFTSLNLSH